MNERVPSFYVLVPGPWRDAEELRRALGDRGVAVTCAHSAPVAAHEIRVDVVAGSDLAQAFGWGRRGPLAGDLVRRVSACTHAALVACGFRPHESPGELARLGRALRDTGGVAIRVEASGAASAWEPWLEDVASGMPRALYESAVLLVEDDDGVTFTCGMHAFDSDGLAPAPAIATQAVPDPALEPALRPGSCRRLRPGLLTR